MLMLARFDPDLERSNARAVTEWTLNAGPPLHAPRRMVQHGVRVLDAAIKREEIRGGLVSDFDAASAWTKEEESLLALVEDGQRGSKSGRRSLPRHSLS
jgi:hypothetical protein